MRVALFATCLADQLFPDVAVAAVRLLRHVGVRPEFPAAQTCCGQPAYNAGYHREAADVARHHLSVFEPFDRVVLPSGSCGAMVVKHYPELFPEGSADFERALDLARRTVELTTFLVHDLERVDLAADLAGVRVTYHDSCHAMRGLGVRDAPRALLRAAGATLLEADGHDACCGFGGLFSVKMPDVSSAMARAKQAGVRATGADVLTSTDGGCLMQLGGAFRRTGDPVEVLHVAELLWRGVERGRSATARGDGAHA